MVGDDQVVVRRPPQRDHHAEGVLPRILLNGDHALKADVLWNSWQQLAAIDLDRGERVGRVNRAVEVGEVGEVQTRGRDLG